MTQKSILITGSSSGIGLDAARGLRDAGWRVFASCRKAEDCVRLQSEGFESPLIDYRDPESIVTGLVETLEATGGTLDALYNNGAYACPGAVEDLPVGALRDIFETNVFGWHELTRLVIPVMRAQGHGRIINCSSVLGFVGMKWRGAYVASKFALEGLTDVLRMEMQNTPIKVILIEPGPVTSKIRENAIPHFEKWIDPKASARAPEYAEVMDRLYQDSGPDRFELPAAAVTKKLLHALTSPAKAAVLCHGTDLFHEYYAAYLTHAMARRIDIARLRVSFIRQPATSRGATNKDVNKWQVIRFSG